MGASGFSPVQYGLITGRADDIVRVPFTFEISVRGGVGAEGGAHPLQIAQWFDAWSYWWSRFAFDVATPEEGLYPNRIGRVIGRTVPSLGRNDESASLGVWDLAIMHPSDLAGISEVKSYLNRPRQKLKPTSGDFELSSDLNALIRRDRRPGPDDTFWYELASGADRVMRGPQLFCVGIPWDRWGRPLDAGKSAFDEVVFEVGFESCEMWLGSGETRGRGWFLQKIGPAMLGAFMSLAGEHVLVPVAEPIMRKAAIEWRVNTLYGESCQITGYIVPDLTQIVAMSKAGLQQNDRQGICLHQTAMKLLEIDPGPVDGVAGPKTEAAWKVFEQRWGVEGVDRFSPAYADVMIGALGGMPPK